MMDLYITFDDGRADNLQAAEILFKYNLKATFFVTCDFLQNPKKYQCFGPNRDALTLRDLQFIVQSGNEIASHGYYHQMDTQDFNKSFDYLKNYNLCEDSVGFSVPNSKFSDAELKTFIKTTENNLNYVRVGRNKKCYSLLSKVHFLLYRMFGIQFSYNAFNKYNLIYKKNKYCINSLVIKKTTKLKSLIKFIEKYSKRACSLVLMFHSIVDTAYDPWEWNREDFISLCKYLKNNNKINCMTLSEF